MPLAQNLTSFNSGELSPLLDARTDIEKYVSGCRELQNFIPTPYGPNMRRPGTELLGDTYDAANISRLLPFVFSETTKYQLELGDQIIRFWDASAEPPVLTPYARLIPWQSATGYVVGNMVQYPISGPDVLFYKATINHTSSGSFATDLADGKWVLLPYQTQVTPYTSAELIDVQFVQINDLAYFTHPNHPPQLLTRGLYLGEIFFSFREMPYDWPPLLDQFSDFDANGNSIQLSMTATTGNIVVSRSGLPSYGTLFQPGHVGAYFQISHTRTDASTPRVLTASGTSSSVRVLGAWSLFTYGTWTGSLAIERSYDNGTTWTGIRLYAAAGDRNIAVDGNEKRDCLLRLKYTGTGSAGANAVLQLADAVYNGLVKITAVPSVLDPSGDSADALVIRDLYSTDPTFQWSEGAWSDYRGYPRSVAVHEDRVLYGGTSYRPQSIWGTQIDDFQNFRLGSIDSDALYFTIASTRTSIIQWMASKDGFLHVGRQGSEGRVNASDAGASISPSDLQWTSTTSYGSKHLPAVILNDALLFVQGQGRKIRSLAQVANTAAFSGQDVTILSEHITDGEIVEFAAQNLPDAILWCIRGDGVLLGMSYDSLSSLVAWHRHVTQGFFESVSVIPGTFGDEVWFIVRRDIDGETRRFVERFRPGWREIWEDSDKPNWWYLDCARTFTVEEATASPTGLSLSFFNGEDVGVLADGADGGVVPCSGNSITIPFTANKFIVGFPYDSIMRPMKLNADLRNGTSQGRKSKIDRMVLRLLKSLGGKYSTDGVNYQDIPTRSAQDMMDQSPPVQTGDTYDLVDRGNHRPYAEIWIKQDAPMPLTVLSIVAKWSPSSD